ncbi:MAG TPA: Gfo/Idh/MocA family oxidoreductase [Gemmatimonadales bacterium]|nr:Gfo/Idh/MocA family oxidoreductase [Gemmatimonadales bacterium]
MPGPSVSLQIGVIGTGFGRRVQLPALRLVSGAKIAAVASGSLERARAVAKEFDIPQAFGSGEELARAPGMDLVIVSSTPDAHVRHAVAALEAGKHVLCEKPMALTAREAQQMVEVAAQSSGVARIDHELRYEPNRRKVQQLIRAGAIGSVWHIELFLKPYLRGDGRPQALDAPWNWWYDAARGGGILGAVGSHLIDLCRFWTGTDVVDVQGGIATLVRERLDEQHVARPVTADDFASFVLRLGGGAVVTVTLSTVASHGTGHFAQITGSEGTLVLTGETKLEIGRRAAELEDISVPDDLWERTSPNNMWARSFVRLMQDLVGVLAGRPPTGEPATFHDGLAVQRVMDAVRAGRGVRLD